MHISSTVAFSEWSGGKKHNFTMCPTVVCRVGGGSQFWCVFLLMWSEFQSPHPQPLHPPKSLIPVNLFNFSVRWGILLAAHAFLALLVVHVSSFFLGPVCTSVVQSNSWWAATLNVTTRVHWNEVSLGNEWKCVYNYMIYKTSLPCIKLDWRQKRIWSLGVMMEVAIFLFWWQTIFQLWPFGWKELVGNGREEASWAPSTNIHMAAFN